MTENESSGKKVYFAGPLFNQAEKDFNLELTGVLEEYGYEVFLPQRDGIEAALLEGKKCLRSMATRFSCRSVMG